jgi:hypothetical protein
MPTAVETVKDDLASGLGIDKDDMEIKETIEETYKKPAFEPTPAPAPARDYGYYDYDDYGGGFARRRLAEATATTTVATTTVTTPQPVGGCAAVYKIAEDPGATLFKGVTSFDGSSVTCRETLESTMSTSDQPKKACPGQIVHADGRADWCNGHGACDRASGVCVCDCSAGVCYQDGACACPEGLVSDPADPGVCRIAEELIQARATAAAGALLPSASSSSSIIPGGTPTPAPTPNPTVYKQEFLYFSLSVTLRNIHTKIFAKPEIHLQFQEAVAFAITEILAAKEDRRSLAEIIVHARRLAAYIVSKADVEMVSYVPDAEDNVVVKFKVVLPAEDANYLSEGIKANTLTAAFNDAVGAKLKEQDSSAWASVEPAAIISSASTSAYITDGESSNGGGAAGAIIGVLIAFALVVGLLLAVRHHRLRESAGAAVEKSGVASPPMTRVTSMSTDVVISDNNRQVRANSGFEQANPMQQAGQHV